MTDTDYSNEVQDVVDALNAVYENKQANKKDTLSGDYSSDTESYPTCKAVKGAYGTRVTSWQSTPSDSNIPSEKLVKDALDGKSGTGHGHATGEITNSTSLGNIGSNLTTQADINSALNTIIGTLKGTKFIEIVDNLPIPSADTMGKLYIVSENSKVNVYYTKSLNTGTSTVYAMVKMDADILDELSVAWSDITDKPSSFTPSSHSHSISDVTNLQTTLAGKASTSDMINEVKVFAGQLAEAINPSS